MANFEELSMLIQEAYFGKSDTIQQMETVLHAIIQECNRNSLGDITNNKHNKMLESLIKEQFGFKDVYCL